MKVTSKITKETMTNRYGDSFVFTLLEDGNIQWEGNFEYCRFGWPNDYTQAFFEYIRDTGGGINLEQFKELVHEYDDEKEAYVIDRKYRELITSRTGVINMVDPSGGPYLKEGMKIMGKTIKEFKSNKEGYLIITK
jgi:hypothetical protein